VSLSDRDRKLMIGLIPIVLLAAFWFLLLAPKRQDASAAGKELTEQEQRRDSARQQLDAAKGAKTDFAADYGEIVRLGKAIPTNVDMPSLLVQLDRAAAGTDLRFTRIATTGDRSTAAATPAPPATTDSSQPPAAAGGETAQSAPGGAAEAANNTAAQQNEQAAQTSGLDATDTQTSTSSGKGLPVGGGSTAATAGSTATTSPVGLETVPLELEFVGNFFNLADFFHDVKRFVRVVNTNVVVGGRLVTIEGVKFASDPELFPRIKAQLIATVYLSPKTEGVTAGASPQGPAPATDTQATPASDTSTTPSSPAPAATVTPPGQ
jgi:Tfp pilus assembly protein PilO